MTPRTISEGDTVRVTAGPNTGLEGRVLNIHHATSTHVRRAFVEFDLFDGPHRTYVPLAWLARATKAY